MVVYCRGLNPAVDAWVLQSKAFFNAVKINGSSFKNFFVAPHSMAHSKNVVSVKFAESGSVSTIKHRLTDVELFDVGVVEFGGCHGISWFVSG